MPSIQGPKNAPEYVTGKRNTVHAVTPAQLLGVSWVDGDGAKRMALVIQFGKDNEDNGAPGVYILADEEEMGTQLKIANKTVKQGVREWLAKQSNTPVGEIPESLTGFSPEEPDENDITKTPVG